MAEPAQIITGRVPGALLLGGKYRLERPIAIGGMGSVWCATHTTLDSPVAVKFVDVDRTNDQVVERFLREAKVAAGIRHPNIIDILDFGRTEGGEPIMVMELLEGKSLHERLGEDQPLATLQVVEIAAQILSGLDAVHRAGIVHRDLKPGNVFLSFNDREIFARLLDFGISFSLDPDSENRRGRFGTHDNLVVGTPEYMAPEQAEGRPDIDVRADIYSIAVILYEALAGVLPYESEHPGTVLFKVMQGECVSLEHLRPDIPEIASVVSLAMHRDRDQRPASARDFRRLLLSAAGVSGEITGSFRAVRSSGVGFRAANAQEAGADGVSSGTVRIPVSRDATTAAFGSGRSSSPPGRMSSVPPPPSAVWTVGLVAVGAVLTLLVAGAIWFFAARGPAAPPVAASSSSSIEPSAPMTEPSAVAAPEPAALPVAAATRESSAAPVVETEPSAAVGERRPSARAGRRRPAEAEGAAGTADESAPTRRGVVRELDF